MSPRILVLTAVLAAAGCRQPVSQKTQETSSATNMKDWDKFVDEFIDAYFAAHPDEAVVAGRHELDGRLPDWSPDGIKREIGRLHEARERAMSFGDAPLDEQRRFERDYLVARVDGTLFWLESAETPFKNPYFYADPLDPDVYISRDYAPLPVRMQAYVNYAKAVPGAVAQVRSNLRLPLPRTYVKIGRTTIGGLASTYAKDVPAVFASVRDRRLQSEFRTANSAAIEAVKEFDAWLQSQQPRATDSFALGRDKFSEMLKSTERVDVPLDKLEEIGRQDLERNLAALREACAKFAPGQTLSQCVAKVQADKPEGGPVEGARQQLEKLKQFVLDRNLVSIPGTEEARVKEAPPYKRWNFAYINIPGPYEKDLPSIYYIAPPDPSWSPAQRAEYVPGKADLLFTSVHEVWPGHFLQFLHANRAQSKFGRIFVGYAFAEGWAHYAEEMMWEAGLGNGDAATHVGQLLNALLRNVRFLSAIGLHTKGMTVSESEQMFRESAYQDPGNAQQQAERGTFDPAYINYTLGKLMIRKLRDEWTALHGGRAAWKDFHDQFLKYGGPPIPLVRAALLGREAGSAF